MKKRALISVVSRQNNEDDPIKVITPGKFYEKGGTYYIQYEETEISGMKGTTTIYRVKDGEFVMTRKGSTNTRMTFKDDYKDIVMYHTPHGTLEFMVETKELEINIDELGGNINVSYDMIPVGQEAMDITLEINIQAKEDIE